MAQSDLETYLQDLLLRFDPSMDLSDGSRAQTEIVEPILGRIGADPFDQDIPTFVLNRIAQARPDLKIAETDALRDTLVNPMMVLLEPIVREIKLINLRRSLSNVERLSDDEVDALAGNFFESRRAGGYARGVVRIYFTAPVTVGFTLIQVASTSSGLRFLPSPTGQSITKDAMLFNRDGQEYYVDISYVAEKRGDEYNVDRNEIRTIANLASATRVRNLNRFDSGLPRENSVEYVARIESKGSDRTLTTSRGILSELTDNFPSVRRMQVIGFKDPEMERDVVQGGGFGPVLAADSFGDAFGDAVAVDDGDGNTSTRRISAPTGNFVSRIGSAGTDPSGFYITLVYFNPTAIIKDVAVTRVVSDTDILVDYEIPGFPLLVHWALRRKELTISSIPGGITMPDTPEGDLILRSDEVHLGGKTDVYVAGAVEAETVAIEGISDEEPFARGSNAQTQGSTGGSEALVLINDPPGGGAAFAMALSDGFYSLVLDEGVDAGAYDIRAVTYLSPTQVELRVSALMTGTAANLLWKVVDEINIELTEPKDIKLLGSDLAVVAGNSVVTTLGSTNFIDANVQTTDILRVDADLVGGEYSISAVGAVTLVVDPAPPRTMSNLSYTIYRGTGNVRTPVVNLSSIELLDSGGAPNGIKIPYRDPVAIVTRGFQNEGSGVDFEGYPTSIGLVTSALGPSLAFGAGLDLELMFYNPEKVYAGTTSKTLSPSGLIVVTLVGTLTPAAVAAFINAVPALNERQLRVTVITYNDETFLGFYCPEHLVVGVAGLANGVLGFSVSGRPSSNADILLPATYKPRRGDLLEFIGGNNEGSTRVLVEGPRVMVGLGPTDESIYATPLHEVSVLLPEVGVRMRGGRPSVGSARAYFLAPTSAEFRYQTTAFSTLVGTDLLQYRPDPENDRVIQPAPPLVDLPMNGVASFGSDANVFSDTTVDFQALNVRPGDLLDVLYRPVVSTSALATPGTIATIVGQTLILRLDENPWVTINFPVALTRSDIADYINEQLGVDVASINGSGFLVLKHSVSLVSIRGDSSILAGPNPLFLDAAPRSTKHDYAGTFVVSFVNPTSLALASVTPFIDVIAIPDSAYRIRRYLQRTSSTEMNERVDSTGLYYLDVELLSLTPGDRNNAPGDLVMEVTGVVADGYRLYADNDTLTYSRAEKLYAGLSRSILLVGSSDSPEEYVQLSRQNIQVSYERSQLVDDIQSFCDSDAHRVVNEEILVRHLLPHYVNLAWRYVGGELESAMRTALTAALEEVDANEELELITLKKVLTSRGATSIYSLSPESPTGRGAPVMVVVYHDIKRQTRALIVRDFIKTSRTQRFLAGDLAVVRVAPGTIR